MSFHIETLLLCLLVSTLLLIQNSDGKENDEKGVAMRDDDYCSTKSSNKTEECRNGMRLVLAQVVFRHGDRTPLYTWPKDPHNHLNSNATMPKTFQRQGLLTKRGKVQAYELGTFLATRYKEFLKGAWVPDDIYVQSSEMDRTVMTAQTLLSGLFPPSQCPEKEPGGCEGRWSRDIRWQPVPVFTIPKKCDNRINFQRNRKSCPAYVSELESYLNCEDIQAYLSSHQKMFADIKENTGLESVGIENIGLIYDTLFVQSAYDLPLPNWTTPYYPNPLKEIEELGFQILSNSRSMMRFNGGPLLKEMTNNMKKTVASRCPKNLKKGGGGGSGVGFTRRQKKLYLFSGHDTTVAGFLATLDLLHTHQPAYTSAVIVELHEPIKKKAGGDTKIGLNEYVVKVFYRNASKGKVEELIIPKCGNPCHLDKLVQVSSDLFVADWARACDGTDTWMGWLFSPFRKFVGLLVYLKNLCYRTIVGSGRFQGVVGGGSGDSDKSVGCGCK